MSGPPHTFNLDSNRRCKQVLTETYIRNRANDVYAWALNVGAQDIARRAAYVSRMAHNISRKSGILADVLSIWELIQAN